MRRPVRRQRCGCARAAMIACGSAPARNSSVPVRNWLIGINRSSKELGFGSVQSRQSVCARCGTPTVLRDYRWRRPPREIRRWLGADSCYTMDPARRSQSWVICVDEVPLRTPHMPMSGSDGR